jgi:hypothetical protein
LISLGHERGFVALFEFFDQHPLVVHGIYLHVCNTPEGVETIPDGSKNGARQHESGDGQGSGDGVGDGNFCPIVWIPVRYDEKNPSDRNAGEERSFWTVETNFPGSPFPLLSTLIQYL